MLLYLHDHGSYTVTIWLFPRIWQLRFQRVWLDGPVYVTQLGPLVCEADQWFTADGPPDEVPLIGWPLRPLAWLYLRAVRWHAGRRYRCLDEAAE